MVKEINIFGGKQSFKPWKQEDAEKVYHETVAGAYDYLKKRKK